MSIKKDTDTRNIISTLIKTNKIRSCEDCILVSLNHPENFVYDVSEIQVRSNFDDKFEIECDVIPFEIKMNMLKFKDMDFIDYIKFLEIHLNEFLSNKIPEIPLKIEELLKENQLPRQFKFPLHKIIPNVFFEGNKENIASVSCTNLNVMCKCERCKELNVFDGINMCKKCKTSIGINYVPSLNPDYLGFLTLSRCEFVIFSQSKFQFECSNCFSLYETGFMNVNDKFSLKCYSCFKIMKLSITKLQYYKKFECKINEGSELIDKGICKHYKKSYRWFIFPCCGSAFPCDICHDESTGHEHALANKMICGFCSKQQSVKKECESCKNSSNKKGTAHWEGGKGNRDKSTLSKKDSKKYKS